MLFGWFENTQSYGGEKMIENLLEWSLDYSGVPCFPRRLQNELSLGGPLSEQAVQYLVSNSVICDMAHNHPASFKITERVYGLGRPGKVGLDEIDEWIAWGLGGQSLYNRLEFCGPLLSDWLSSPSRIPQQPAVVADLGGGPGTYGFRALKPFSATSKPANWKSIDCDEESLQLGRLRAHEAGLSDVVTFHNANFMSRSSYPQNEERADLLILIGVLCGMTPEVAVDCLRKIKPHGKEHAEILAATLLVKSFEEDPLVYQLLARLGWTLRPKTSEKVEALFAAAGYQILNVYSERADGDGEYAIVRARIL